MGTGRTLNKKPATRPRKTGAERRRRDLVQSRRLIALGVAEDVVKSMNTREVKDMLKRPARIKRPA
jgi:hypothetical protein